MPNDRGPEKLQWTVLKAVQWTAGYFERHRLESPRLDAEVLLAHILGCGRIDLYVRHDQPLNEDELARFRRAIQRRLNHEPIAYIVGRKEFWSLKFEVSPAVLIPRPDTECLVEIALRFLPGQKEGCAARILELGVGSGAVIVSLAHERPACFFWASDSSRAAVEIARRNARHQVEGRISFFTGHWLEAVAAHPFFDMILSNPPYIPTLELERLPADIRCHEPLGALNGGPDGLREIQAIMEEAHFRLKAGGELLLEIGFDQRPGIEKLAAACAAYEAPQFYKDYAGHDRVVRMRKRE